MSGRLELVPADEDEWADRITSTWRKSVGAIIETGKLLIEAKAALPHGGFEAMVRGVLFPFNIRSAQMLMKIAEHPTLADARITTQGGDAEGRWLDALQLEVEAEVAATGGFHGPVLTEQRIAASSLDIVDHARQALQEEA